MTFESTVITRPGTLIINPAIGEPPRQPAAQQPGQDDSSRDQSNQRAEIVVKRGNSESFAQADKFREQQGGQFASSRPIGVDAYQSLSLESRRDEIKQMMGVDTYA